MKLLLASLILTLTCFATTQAEPKCFQLDSLQGRRIVNLEINGNRVAGTFTVERDESSRTDYKFTGTRRGNKLTIKFTENLLPDVAPSKMKSLVWTLVRTKNKELLRIKFCGKNYETNRYADYFADFEPCDSVR